VSDLFSSLGSAARALEAQRYGLEVTGQNIANVNTPGYSRRTADFSPLPPDNPRSAGRGVDVIGVRSVRDRMLERRLMQELPAEHREGAIAESLSIVETTLGKPGSSIDARLTAFYDSFASLAEDPTSPIARQEVAVQGEALAAAFRDMSQRLDLSTRDTDAKVRNAVEEINDLSGRIAAINQNMATATGGSLLHMEDEQQGLVRELSELVDISVLPASNGRGVDITFGNGRPLVIGKEDYSILATSAGPSGFAQLSSEGFDTTSEITGGRLGGLLHVRDVQMPDYKSRLDTLAYEVVGQVNGIHQAGYDQTGTSGRDFFTQLGSSAGAAGAITIDAALAADHGRIAAAGINASGDNAVARELAGLRDARVLNGGTSTLGDAWSQLVYRVGRDAQSANGEYSSRKEIVRQVDALRDQVSGISLDEEAMNLLKYQRAYEANARFFSVIDRTLEMMLQTLAR
jgi:flagellar hook-associated protein 1 FlgK